MQVLLVDKTVAVLVDHIEGLFEFLNFRCVIFFLIQKSGKTWIWAWSNIAKTLLVARWGRVRRFFILAAILEADLWGNELI
jgi:hypothetical protein